MYKRTTIYLSVFYLRSSTSERHYGGQQILTPMRHMYVIYQIWVVTPYMSLPLPLVPVPMRVRRLVLLSCRKLYFWLTIYFLVSSFDHAQLSSLWFLCSISFGFHSSFYWFTVCAFDSDVICTDVNFTLQDGSALKSYLFAVEQTIVHVLFMRFSMY